MSIERTFDLIINAGTSSPLVINANQNDSGEIWKFNLYQEDGTKVIPAAGEIVGLKSDGHAIVNAGTVNASGQVVITETAQITAAVGANVFEIVFDSVHGTANFILYVEKSPVDDDADFSESDISAIQQAIAMSIDAQTVAALQTGLQNEAQTRAAQDAQLASGIATETANREAADAVLRQAIDDAAIVPAGSTVVVDNTLSIAGAAADAKATGDAVSDLNQALSDSVTNIGKYGVYNNPNVLVESDYVQGVWDAGIIMYNTYRVRTKNVYLLNKGDSITAMSDSDYMATINSYETEPDGTTSLSVYNTTGWKTGNAEYVADKTLWCIINFGKTDNTTITPAEAYEHIEVTVPKSRTNAEIRIDDLDARVSEAEQDVENFGETVDVFSKYITGYTNEVDVTTIENLYFDTNNSKYKQSSSYRTVYFPVSPGEYEISISSTNAPSNIREIFTKTVPSVNASGTFIANHSFTPTGTFSRTIKYTSLDFGYLGFDYWKAGGENVSFSVTEIIKGITEIEEEIPPIDETAFILQTEWEVGSIYSNSGVNYDGNKAAIRTPSGTKFYIPEDACVVCKNDLIAQVYAFEYNADGTFVQRIGGTKTVVLEGGYYYRIILLLVDESIVVTPETIDTYSEGTDVINSNIGVLLGEVLTTDVGTDYVLATDYVKHKIAVEKIGEIELEQAFFKYNDKYYSTYGSSVAIQDSNFNLISETPMQLGHGNAFQLGHNGKAYASGWDDQKIYIVDVSSNTPVLSGSITLPTTGYTTCAVDDINQIAYIFQRDSYPDTEDYYNFIVYDYANDSVISTKKITVPMAAMQAVDFVDDKIYVLNGLGSVAAPNGYRVFDTAGNLLYEYKIGSLGGEPEGVFVDRTTKDMYISYINSYLYKVSVVYDYWK